MGISSNFARCGVLSFGEILPLAKFKLNRKKKKGIATIYLAVSETNVKAFCTCYRLKKLLLSFKILNKSKKVWFV